MCAFVCARQCAGEGAQRMCLLCIHVVPFTKCHTNLPSGQREHIYCYSSASDRESDAGMDGYLKGERDRAVKAAQKKKDRGMDEWAERRQKKDR